jgi:hypothetical protein
MSEAYPIKLIQCLLVHSLEGQTISGVIGMLLYNSGTSNVRKQFFCEISSRQNPIAILLLNSINILDS